MAGCEFGHHGHRNTGSFIISDKFRLSNPLPSYMGKKKKGVTSIYTSWPVWWTPFTFYYLRWKSGITDILGYLSRCWTKTFFFLEIRNKIQEQKPSILSPPSPKKRTGPFQRTVDSLCTSSLASPEWTKTSVTRQRGWGIRAPRGMASQSRLEGQWQETTTRNKQRDVAGGRGRRTAT